MAESDDRSATSRRRFLGGALGAVGAVAAGSAGFGVARASEPDASRLQTHTDRVPFYGRHQAGIATPAQDRLAFAAFDVTAFDKESIAVLMGEWAGAAAQMTKGLPISAIESAPEIPPYDTGEALGLGASNLTVTVGFGPSLFDDRFGLASKRPAALADLPALPGDQLRKDISDGDLCVQACADDPTVAFHVIRNFARIARKNGTAVMRYSQLGFGRTASTSRHQPTERNLLGFKDGTNNIKDQDVDDFDDYVWVGDETDQPWMRGGSYLVSRRIGMRIESWDADVLGDQEHVFGRSKVSGAPLTGKHEFDTIDFHATTKNGAPVVDDRAHIRLAAPQFNAGRKILRRGYSYTDGINQDTGLLDAGLFFIAYQKNPHDQFVRIQRQLGQYDLLNEYIQHTGSAVFAVPPGLSKPGDWWGKEILS